MSLNQLRGDLELEGRLLDASILHLGLVKLVLASNVRIHLLLTVVAGVGVSITGRVRQLSLL